MAGREVRKAHFTELKCKFDVRAGQMRASTGRCAARARNRGAAVRARCESDGRLYTVC